MYSINSPARFRVESDTFETLNIVVDIENNSIELVSEDKKNIIKLDLTGLANLEESLSRIVNSEHFQASLREKILEHRSRYNAINDSTL